MPARLLSSAFFCIALSLLFAGCDYLHPGDDPGEEARLETAANVGDNLITGVAVSENSHLFVNQPFWLEDHTESVWEVVKGGADSTARDRLRPYPNAEWNQRWTPSLSPQDHFISVQSVYIDPRNASTLWVLDPASPMMEGVVPGGAKLVEIDLATDEVVRTVVFDSTVAPRMSYLNDVRVDAQQQWAYITGSSLGALVVVNLGTGEARRVLEEHPSTKPDSSYVVTVDGNELRLPSGAPARFAADGIALGRDDQHVYYRAINGLNLYRLPAEALQDPALSNEALAAQVELVDETVVTDGMLIDEAGNVYHTAVERDAVIRYTAAGRLETVVQSEKLLWPDSYAMSPEGDLYVTTSQLHLLPMFNDGADLRTAPHRVFKVSLGE